jgi:hypothetical protein
VPQAALAPAPQAAPVPAPQAALATAPQAALPLQWCNLLILTDVCPDECLHIIYRHCKRATSVSAVKATRHFKRAQAASWLRAGWMPQTPDPWDRSLSKRAWETAMQDWRRTMKFLYHFER